MNPNDSIAVVTDDGVTLYGANGKAFKIVPKEQLSHESSKTSKIGNKEPVNNVDDF